MTTDQPPEVGVDALGFNKRASSAPDAAGAIDAPDTLPAPDAWVPGALGHQPGQGPREGGAKWLFGWPRPRGWFFFGGGGFGSTGADGSADPTLPDPGIGGWASGQDAGSGEGGSGGGGWGDSGFGDGGFSGGGDGGGGGGGD